MADFNIGDFIAQIIDGTVGARGAGQNRGSTAADIADPFRHQRGNYTDQLLQMMKDPPKYESSPGYKFGLDQGLEGVARKGNAMFGTTRSGNTAIELEKYATGFAQQDYDKWVDQQNTTRNQLMELAGVRSGSPSVAAQAYLGGFEKDDQSRASGLAGAGDLLGLLGQGAGGIAQFIKGLFSGGGSGGDFSGIDLTGSTDDFFRSIGLDPENVGTTFGIDPSVWERISNVLDDGGSLVQGGGSLDLGDGISDSTRGILEGIFGKGGF